MVTCVVGLLLVTLLNYYYYFFFFFFFYLLGCEWGGKCRKADAERGPHRRIYGFLSHRSC